MGLILEKRLKNVGSLLRIATLVWGGND